MFGIITTIGACRHGYWQAAALGKALQRLERVPPCSVIGRAEHLRGLDRHGWNLVETEDVRLQRGFESKLHLHEYAPYRSTLFLDSDILPFSRQISLERFLDPLSRSGSPLAYYARKRGEGGFQGSDLHLLCKRLGVEHLHCTEAGGHYFWKTRDEAHEVFQRALEINAERWPEIARFKPAIGNHWHTPDEVLVAVALAQVAPAADLPCGHAINRVGNHLDPSKEVLLAHYLGDAQPVDYFVRCLRTTGSLSIATHATFHWAKRMGTKAIRHYRLGGSKRVRLAASHEASAVPEEARPERPEPAVPAGQQER